MGILTKLFNRNKNQKRKPSKKACYFCKRQTNDMRTYKNEYNQTIKVCPLCVEYAERRAYIKP
ncbi:hypothetical protein DKZ56_08820 [Ureibacillus thermophilus]|uniref:Uncharacterized protein n=1 Tax=Ureibacillus thermophilus TaxID=367743 RepID=A0A4P6US83_9BACL|nr:hypothetical protein DKZ56_08820 [Ureibacillus thermophilus]